MKQKYLICLVAVCLVMGLALTSANLAMVRQGRLFVEQGRSSDSSIGDFEMRIAEKKPPDCKPTPTDALGPFYTPDAPVRSSVGKGYVLTGMVKSARDCSPLAGARIEFWLAGPDGDYDDDHRATVFSGESGNYRFESNAPPKYTFRPPHIHIRVSADGHKTLITQYYPNKGDSSGTFDLVLILEQ